MDLTSDSVSFITRYARTALDLVIFLRPKRFVETVRTEADKYLEPLPFLFVSLGISTIVGYTFASMLLEGEELAALDRIGILGTAVVIAAVWLLNLFPIFVGKGVAILFRIDASLQDLFNAYCYSSIFFPFFVAANQAAFFTYTEPSVGPVIFAFVVQLLFVSFLITMMGREAQIPRPKFAKFFVLTWLSLFSVGTLIGGIAASSEREGVALQQHHFLLDACDRAVLYGTVQPHGLETIAWFEWGETRDLGNVTTKQLFTDNTQFSYPLDNVKENTTYFYRAIASNSRGIATGTLLSFTTPLCGV